MRDSRLSKDRAAVAVPDRRVAAVAVASARVVAVVAACRVAAAVAVASVPAAAAVVVERPVVAVVAAVSAPVAAAVAACRVVAVAAVSAPVVVAAAARSQAADPQAVDSFCVEALKDRAPPASRARLQSSTLAFNFNHSDFPNSRRNASSVNRSIRSTSFPNCALIPSSAMSYAPTSRSPAPS